MLSLAVVHGLGEHSGRYDRLAAAMLGHGISTFAVDLRGMGRSDGSRGHVSSWSRWIEDLVGFRQLVEEHSPGREVVPLGHSFGGVVVTSAILAGALRPARFALSNPAFVPAVKVSGAKVALGRLASRVAPGLTLSNEVNPATVSRDPAVVTRYREDPLVHDKISARLYTEWMTASADCLARAAELEVPFYLLVSEQDRLIDPEGSRRFERSATVAHVTRSYPDRFHEPFNDLDADEVFADLARWLVPSA